MKIKLLVCFCLFSCFPLFTQTHNSVSLENNIYHILEQAEIRGLCGPLSGIKPYTQSVVVTAIKEILNSEKSDKIKKSEREILEQYLEKFSKPKTGMDWRRGAWYGEAELGKNTVSANMGASVDIGGSIGLYSEDLYWGTETWLQAYVNGDLGSNISYGFIFGGGLVKAQRESLGEYNTYYKNFDNNEDPEYQNKLVNVYSEPLTHFPYSYKKRWDGSIYLLNNPDIFESWPNSPAGGYYLPAELTASFIENKLIMRLGRISHEWSSTSFGSSLAFNQMARPFLGIEGEFNPVSWFSVASLTGILEYFNTESIYESSRTSQNAFSINMLQFRYKNYLFFDFIDAVIWPKRLEFGYISPVTNNFFYQNNVGKFDNMAITLNLKAQYPGLGNIWLSFFVDEMNLTSDLLTLDRQMLAMQGGLNVPLPFLPFASMKLSYTRINPYCYTHHRNYEPWYGDMRMEKAYTNNGVSLGHYLPPNSDEMLVRFQAMPFKNVSAHLQYQLIRHGADFGPNAVDGSNLLSELDPDGRDTKDELKRFFLHDGAYQWNHIVKIGAEWNLPKQSVSFFCEGGAVISYFTNTKEPANSGEPYPYEVIDTAEYPKSTAFIFTFGLKIYPR
jgi:hypothetical protein